MSNPSNLYAEKVFAEHPIALWSLDDNADFLSLISESDRDILNWNVSIDGVPLSENDKSEIISIELNDQNEPLSGVTKVYSILGTPTQADYGEIQLISPEGFGSGLTTLSFEDLNILLGTFTVGLYVKSAGSILNSFSIGYRYLDPTTNEYKYFSEDFRSPQDDKWMLGAKTFQALQENANIELVITLKYIGGSGDQAKYKFLLHGLSFGQWSEEFLSESIGVEKQSLPPSILGAGIYGVPAQAYGISDADGWYIVNDNMLDARNTSIPMVYGAANTTVLYPNSSLNPSIVLPAQNFLTQSGKYQDMTFEAWFRINSSTSTPKRIFGNLRGSDGLYVDGPFLIWKYGNNVISHQVSEWGKPMLLQVSVGKDLMVMMVDGEQVASTTINAELVELPESTSIVSGITLDNNWLGFWAYNDIQPIEIDSVAIYPYRVPEIVAKRRFAYAQAVEIPENINTAYSGTSIVSDFSVAQYANSFMYPDLGKWETSTSDNVSTKDKVLSAPTYAVPNFTFSSGTYQEWLTNNSNIQNESNSFFSIKPNQNSPAAYGLLPNLFLGNKSLSTVYGLFKIKSSEDQALFVFEDKKTGNSLSIKFDGTDIKYILKYGSSTTEITGMFGIGNDILGEIIPVGINIPAFVAYYGGNVARLFGNTSDISLYIGGYKDFSDTFSGNIYSVGLCSPKNHSKISHLFSVTGVFKQFENVFDLPLGTVYDAGDSYFGNGGGYYDNDGNFIDLGKEFWEYYIDGGSPTSFAALAIADHVATNTIYASNYLNSYQIDSKTDSSWQDYIPLKSFAKYVTLPNGQKQYELDFIQMNIGYPSPTQFKVLDETGTWTYSELQFEYANPTHKSYDDLANPLLSDFDTYIDLAYKSKKDYVYDTSNSLVKTYVSFQYLNTSFGPTMSLDSFATIVPANKNGVVKPGVDWISTAYEVVDNMVIYPPRDVDMNQIALVTHVSIKTNGSKSNPARVKYIKYASQALNYKTPTPIGTKFGSQIFPYTKLGAYYDYKSANPFTTYRETSPYLYLTRNSGIQLKGDFSSKISRGVSIPINRYKTNDFKLLAMQVAVRYDQDFFSYYPVEVFELDSNNQNIKIYMQSVDQYGKRARLYAVNAKTGENSGNIVFYINGKLTKDPVITVKEWAMLGLSFPSLIDFSLNPGSFRVSGPLTTNLVSYYQSTNMQDVMYIEKRPWIEVRNSGDISLVWEFWQNAYIWENVLIIATKSYYGVDPAKIYETYTGTNKILVDDGIVSSIGKYGYTVYKGVTWISETRPAL